MHLSADIVKPFRWSLAVATVALVAACSGGAEDGVVSFNVSPAVIDAVAKRRIVFAHQSVGGNILSGVTRLSGNAIVVRQERDIAPGSAGIRHYYVGENGNPLGKIADFRSLFDTVSVAGVDTALLKLCFLDFAPDTDAAKVAQTYVATLQQLAARHPSVRFIAVTAPLTAVRSHSPRSLLRRVVGRSPSGFDANRRRGEFNRILRSELPGNRVFDLAALEAEGSHGETFVSFDNVKVAVMDARWTNDGGHLNDAGQRRIAAAFLTFLANIAQVPGA
jgi:lysophospholipase L1-like esterase